MLSGAKKDLDIIDSILSRKLVEVYLMKHGISMDSIKQMTEKEVMEYSVILQQMDELEMEKISSIK